MARGTSAWYSASRTEFLSQSAEAIANELAGRAAHENLELQADQQIEWERSVDVLQRHLAERLRERLPALRRALEGEVGAEIEHVILEYDFRRRGLRIDCILLTPGALIIIEFKRSRLGKADRDQVMRYAMNLIEFHQVTRLWAEHDGAIVVPVLAQTDSERVSPPEWPGFGEARWHSVAQRPVECNQTSLGNALAVGLSQRRSKASVRLPDWLNSSFEPSSSIVDATVSLYGDHDVVAIQEHSAPKQEIDDTTAEIRDHIERALSTSRYHLIFLSGAPGAGKTLVGLDLIMRGQRARESVFVTGNAPLVEVLNAALKASFKRSASGRKSPAVSFGYPKKYAAALSDVATYKIDKAHRFLGERGKKHHQLDGRVLVFDEGQRTYEKGRQVLGKPLDDHEADLILRAQRETYTTGGSVVVALIGHNQAINRGERGMIAWLEAADRQGWGYSISDDTLRGLGSQEARVWADHPRRWKLEKGHLQQSLRYYRNAEVEKWVAQVLDGTEQGARVLSKQLQANGATIWLTRSITEARSWLRREALGDERMGLIASGQGRRLAAEGLFVELKPDIARWMLAPSDDIRSSNALETVQNQYQVQGLELDYCAVCWDADLRREGGNWAAFKLRGEDWVRDGDLSVSLNSYRVLLTRSRKGMILFVPHGDRTGRDRTRSPEFYDGVAEYLARCGAKYIKPE